MQALPGTVPKGPPGLSRGVGATIPAPVLGRAYTPRRGRFLLYDRSHVGGSGFQNGAPGIWGGIGAGFGLCGADLGGSRAENGQ